MEQSEALGPTNRNWWDRRFVATLPAPGRPSINISLGRALFLTSQLAALALAIVIGRYAYNLVNEDKYALGTAVLWIGLGLIFIAYFAWNGQWPRVAAAPSIVWSYVRTHPVELTCLSGIVGIAAFMRLWWYGELPPHDYLYLEEHINGGVAWSILNGDRVYNYPIVRYSTALGLWMFGPSTWGLRSAMVIAGIVVVVPFYLLMREVVERPAALFAAAMYASLRAIADTSAYFQVPGLEVILMLWTMMRGIRTGNAVWFVPAAAFAALVSYEYEVFKAVPLFAGAFLAWIAIRALLWPPPLSVPALWRRVATLTPHAVKVSVIIAVVIAICVGPMIAQKHRGEDVYFASFNRQKGDREARGTPGVFAPNWERQLRQSIQFYTPFVKADYPVVGPIEKGGAVDKVTSVLFWASVGLGIAFFWRGYRALFIGWFIGGMIMSSLLLSVWAPWKVSGWLPPAVALTGFLADDALRLARRFRWRFVYGGVLTALIAVVAAVLVLNARTLNANAHDERLLREWGNTPSQLYAICRNLNERPDDNFAFVSQRSRRVWGFSSAPGDLTERVAAWSDYRFACWGLLGRSVASLQEVWPVYVDEDRPYSFVHMGAPDDVQRSIDALARAMPELGPPAGTETGPGAIFSLAIWDTTRDAINARRGLLQTWISTTGDELGEEIAAGPPFSTEPPIPAAAYRLRGMVYLPAENSSVALTTSAGSAPARITLDGQSSSDTTGTTPVVQPAARLPGWHLVEIEGLAVEGGRVELQWVGSQGQTSDVRADDVFALGDWALWRHTRTIDDNGALSQSVRYDFDPHFIAWDGVRIDTRTPLPKDTRVIQERYNGIWTVPEDGTYRFSVHAPGENVSLIIDDRNIFEGQGTVRAILLADATMTAGEHAVEIVFEQPGDTGYIGGTLTITEAATGELREFAIRPF
jgi:hypothetical protein